MQNVIAIFFEIYALRTVLESFGYVSTFLIFVGVGSGFVSSSFANDWLEINQLETNPNAVPSPTNNTDGLLIEYLQKLK
jgi:hypothetical protein